MVVTTHRNEMIWYQYEMCGFLFGNETDAAKHERRHDDFDTSYLRPATALKLWVASLSCEPAPLGVESPDSHSHWP